NGGEECTPLHDGLKVGTCARCSLPEWAYGLSTAVLHQELCECFCLGRGSAACVLVALMRSLRYRLEHHQSPMRDRLGEGGEGGGSLECVWYGVPVCVCVAVHLLRYTVSASCGVCAQRGTYEVVTNMFPVLNKWCGERE
ncbi:unnamed protein product, partial [Ectocarpus sp. 12 AP-2014]